MLPVISPASPVPFTFPCQASLIPTKMMIVLQNDFVLLVNKLLVKKVIVPGLELNNPVNECYLQVRELQEVWPSRHHTVPSRKRGEVQKHSTMPYREINLTCNCCYYKAACPPWLLIQSHTAAHREPLFKVFPTSP